MENTFKLLLMTIISLLVGCTEYPDEWGFKATLTEQTVEVISADASTSTYDVQIVAKLDGGSRSETISGAYYKIGVIEPVSNYTSKTNYFEVPAEITHNGDQMIVTGILKGCIFGRTYSEITLVMKTDGEDFSYSGSWKDGMTRSFTKSITDMQPSLGINGTSITFTKDYKYRVIASCDNMISEASCTFGGKTKKAEREGSVLVAEFTLSELEIGSFRNFLFKASNEFGETSLNIPYSLTIKGTNLDTSSFADDGEKEDCIRLCGVDWAKGNLVYDNGTWRINEDAVANSAYTNTSSYGEYFSWYYTTCDNTFRYLSTSNQNRVEIQGDISHDVVAAHLPGWVTPTSTQIGRLELYATLTSPYLSYIFGTDGLMLFPAKSGRVFQSGTPITVEIRPKGSLYLPNGLYNKNSGIYRNNNICYLTSTGSLGKSSSYCYTSTFTTTSGNVTATYDQTISYLCKLPVRPVKANN